MKVSLEPATEEAFRSFGYLVAHVGRAVIQPTLGVFEAAPETKPDLFLVSIKKPATLPLKVAELERHPFSAQTFIPIAGGESVVVVCNSFGDGSPDPGSFRAFLIPGSVGITYRRGVWHHRVSALEPSQFAVIMSHAPDGDDTETARLAETVVVVDGQGVSSGGERCLVSNTDWG